MTRKHIVFYGSVQAWVSTIGFVMPQIFMAAQDRFIMSGLGQFPWKSRARKRTLIKQPTEVAANRCLWRYGYTSSERAEGRGCKNEAN